MYRFIVSVDNSPRIIIPIIFNDNIANIKRSPVFNLAAWVLSLKGIIAKMENVREKVRIIVKVKYFLYGTDFEIVSFNEVGIKLVVARRIPCL
mgnify:CR=1 FL=1